MSEESNKLTVKASAKGAEVSVSGEGAGRLSNALADFLSPFSQSAGALGDMVQTYRVENSLRALSRSKRLADELGLALNPVPPKFLLQWTEGVSLEDEGDGDLTDLWAGLLVSASVKMKPTHFLFKRILSELNIEHVHLLKLIADFDHNSSSFDFSSLELGAKPWVEVFRERETPLKFDSVDDPRLVEFIDSANVPGGKVHKTDFGHAHAPGPFLFDRDVEFSFVDQKLNSYRASFATEHLKLLGILGENERTLHILVGEGADKKDKALKFHVLHMTQLGVSFLKACTGLELGTTK